MSVVHAPEESRQQNHQPSAIAARHEAAKSIRGLTAICRAAVHHRLAGLKRGRLVLIDSAGRQEFGPSLENAAVLEVKDPAFYRHVVFGGGLGAADAYIRGCWDSPDLTAVMQVFAANMDVLGSVEKGAARLLQPLRSFAHWLRSNTKAGSRRNISAHYDLSNDFFALMLDPTMTYSSGVFPEADSSLEAASTEKYDRICRKLNLQPSDRVLEIGTGWGGFALHAATHYGCHVTTTTISTQQHDYARKLFDSHGVGDRVTLLQEDYRDLEGRYDKLVSIEMIEAVGEKFLPGYFGKCSELLKDDGVMCLQAITIPDHRYDTYRKGVDFIQQYIFPGGFLPSMSAMSAAVARGTDFRFFHIEEFGDHYARTLAMWRDNFWNRIAAVKDLGFDEAFLRTWHYYLCYCEAGFRERQIGVSQLVLTKPESRLEPLLINN